MTARPLSFPALLQVAVAGAMIAGGVACGNIGLSAVAETMAAGGGAESGHAADASADGGPPLGIPSDGADVTAVDAAAPTAPTTVGNPLCFFAFADGGAHVCQPDTSSQCAPSVEDGGAVTGWEDAGGASPGASDAGAPPTACHVVPQGQACGAPGGGGDGAQCQSSTDCAASFECVGTPGQCRHYCCGGNAACDEAANVTMGATFCDVQPTAAGGQNVPVCEPVTSCILLLTGTANGTCPKGETCAVVKDDGTTSCVATGAVGIGGDCDVYHCAADLTCLGPVGGRTCFQLCQVDAPSGCPYGTTCTSSAQLFTNASVGICQ